MKNLAAPTRTLSRTITVLLFMAAASLASRDGFAAESIPVETLTRPTHYVFSYQGRPVMRYEFAPDKYKSYVQALHTIRGDNVLRDAPYDHLHHHALMYGITVNGINFWEEAAGSGVQKSIEISRPTATVNAGRPETSFTQTLYWVPASDAFLPNTNARPLLIEQRTIQLVINPADSEVALYWTGRFRVGSRTNTVVLTGANYHGLGMRFVQELDPSAMHFHPGGKPDLSSNKQDASVHPWEAITFHHDGRPTTLALFGSPQNARGDAHFFSMKTPFAYLSATQGLDREPLVYKQGDEFELKYMVTVYPSLKTEQELSARAQRR